MPLTTTPILLDDIERNRRIFDRLSQGMQGASKQGVDALVMMENLAKQGRAEERQKALDEQGAGKLVLERKRQDDQDARRAAMHDVDMKLKLRKLEDVQPGLPGGAPRLEPKAPDPRIALQERAQMLQHPEFFTDEQLAASGIKRPAAPAPKAAAPKPAPAPKPPKPDETSARKVAAYKATLEGLQGLKARKQGVNLGPLDSKINAVAQWIGADDSETTRFKADLANEVNQMISALSGANVPEGEMARLRAGLPSPSDQDEAFIQKLESTIQHVERTLKHLEPLATGQAPGMPAVPPKVRSSDRYFGGG